jgi:hypothetical protein
MARWMMWKEPGQVHGGDRRVVVERVVGEGLADEDAVVVDEGVDPSEPIERPIDHALGGLGLCDVAPHAEQVRIIGGAKRARGAHDRVRGPRNAATRPAPMPCGAPVTTATVSRCSGVLRPPVPAVEGREVARIPGLTELGGAEVPVRADLARDGPQVVPEVDDAAR